MRIHAGLVVASIVGSFFVYCGQAATTHDRGGSSVSDGHADGGGGTCCTATAPVFTKLAEGNLTTADATSPVIAVGAYRQVLVYIISGPVGVSGGCEVTVMFRPDASTAFGSTSQYASFGGLIRVDGPDLELFSPCGDSYHYSVAGVQ